MRITRRATLTAVALFAALSAGCSSTPHVRVDKDPSADIRTPRTFAFFTQVATDKQPYTSLVTARLKQATRTQLERQGYTYTEENPDLRVNLFLNMVDRTELRSSPSAGRTFYFHRAGYGTWSAYPGDLETVNYRQGTLAIDLVDAKRSTLIWQGIAEGRVSAKAMKDPGPAIDRAVAEIFADFPEKGKASTK
jgi:hypothetical protein